jgi:hypothetical protein
MDDLYLSLLFYYRSRDPDDSIEREELWGRPLVHRNLAQLLLAYDKLMHI